jgi:hypothetical protein
MGRDDDAELPSAAVPASQPRRARARPVGATLCALAARPRAASPLREAAVPARPRAGFLGRLNGRPAAAVRAIGARAGSGDRRLALVVLGVVAVSIGVRVPGALSLPLWQDEVASARVIVQPTLGDALDQVQRTESTPPAWYVLAWLGHRAGISLDGLRIVSAVLGAACAGLLVVYARRFLPLLAAATAGLLAAVGWQFVAHGRELRAYALYTLLSLAFAMLLERAACRPSAGRLLALALCVAAGALTHYFFVLGAGIGLVWLLTSPLPRGSRLRTSGAIVAGLLPLLVWLPTLVDQYAARRFDWIGDFDGLKAAYLYGTMFDAGGALYSFVPPPFGPRQWWWLAVLVLVLAGAAVLRSRGRVPRSPRSAAWPALSSRLCAMLAVGPVAVALLVWLAGPDVYNTRNLLVAAPFAAVAAAAPLVALRRAVALAGAGALVALASLATVQAAPLGPPADRIARALLAEGWRPESRLVLFADFHAFRSPIGWYLPGRPFLELQGDPVFSGGAPAFLVVQNERVYDELQVENDVAQLSRVDGISVARLRDGGAVLPRLHDLGGAVLAPENAPG